MTIQLSFYCKVCGGSGEYKRVKNGMLDIIRCPLCMGSGLDYGRGKLKLTEQDELVKQFKSK